uniref:Uncharacterized protein n=1 Tax=Siphoviridae sp. ctmxA102 TaxID=2825657 RepID=A0A8S5TVZ8_9CAUD|nr:MAG TPA: hypothetical protein [Siphoviridae sp. ctmxA102]DAU77877.1 MAG TPA: hypothetical protein [Ackermannviridae sp.]
MDLKKISTEQLEVGMKIAVQHPFRYGWNLYTGLTQYDMYIISRITPKRTKVVCGDAEFITKNTIFYEPCEQMYLENRRVKAFVSIMDGMWELETISPTKFICALEEMEETERLVKTLLSRYK